MQWISIAMLAVCLALPTTQPTAPVSVGMTMRQAVRAAGPPEWVNVDGRRLAQWSRSVIGKSENGRRDVLIVDRWRAVVESGRIVSVEYASEVGAE